MTDPKPAPRSQMLYIESDAMQPVVTLPLLIEQVRALWRVIKGTRKTKGESVDLFVVAVQGRDFHRKCRFGENPLAHSYASADPVGTICAASMLVNGAYCEDGSRGTNDPRIKAAHELMRAWLRENAGKGK